MEEITINISSGVIYSLNARILFNEKKMIINGKEISVDDQFLDKLISIILTFKEEYGTRDGIDLEEFNITVKYKGKISKYHGKGIYPNYYLSLKNLLEVEYGK